jgi:hypothetical protein
VKFDRRRFLKDTLLLAGSAMTMATVPDVSASMPELKETDPEAVAIGYYSNARKVDKNKYPTYAAGQTCTICAYVGFSSAMRKPCKLVPGKLVNAGGWCSKWVKRG